MSERNFETIYKELRTAWNDYYRRTGSYPKEWKVGADDLAVVWDFCERNLRYATIPASGELCPILRGVAVHA